MHVKSAWLPGSPVFVVKVGSWFAERARLTGNGASGVIMAFDAQTGDPVALLRDDHHLSDVRTAAACALATRLLAREDSSTVGVLGTGVQAYLQVLARRLPSVPSPPCGSGDGEPSPRNVSPRHYGNA